MSYLRTTISVAVKGFMPHANTLTTAKSFIHSRVGDNGPSAVVNAS